MSIYPLIVLGERGHSPHVLLLGCTIHPDRIEAKAHIALAPLRRGRTLSAMTRSEAGWTLPRGALRAKVPRFAEAGHHLHTPLTVALMRQGKA